MKLFNFLLLTLLFSCAHYVDSFHRQIDRDERTERGEPTPRRNNDVSDYQRYKNKWDTNQDKKPIENPLTYSLGRPSGRVEPTVKRNYRPQRYQANDFRDHDDSGSLWANQGSTASLFTTTNDKRVGDIIVLNVLEDLRNQISTELKSQFPERKKLKDDKTPMTPPVTAIAGSAPVSTDSEMDMKIYDKISGTIIEELNKDYLLVRGRKEIIHRKEKRSIEVQALVSRKDIMENDYVNSDRLLESKVFVLRDKQ